MTDATSFLSGVLTMGYVVASLFFLRFWRASADSLFGWFSAAFLMLATGRALLGIIQPAELLYVLRLAAFLMIIVAIIVKNRRS